MKLHTSTPVQLGFESVLILADAENDHRVFDRLTGHLPRTWEDALPFYRDLLARHHAAMLDANRHEVIRLRGQAEDLAAKLNGGNAFGICAPHGGGKRLEDETATSGPVPLWGQAGSFTIEHERMSLRVEMGGMFGIGRFSSLWPGFSVRVADRRKPFLSETGFRSFIGAGLPCLIPGQTPADFVRLIVSDHVARELGGKLVKVRPQRGH